MRYDLYSEFDLDKHNKTFFNYCEVIITKEGKIIYATPSHQLMALAIYGVELGFLPSFYLLPESVMLRHDDKVKEVATKFIPINESPLEFALENLEAVAVHTTMWTGNPNNIQKKILFELEKSGACNFKDLDNLDKLISTARFEYKLRDYMKARMNR